jgi:hypothetical protein
VPGQELLAVPVGDELCHLRGDEPGELRAVPLDGLEQARIRNRDRRLVGKVWTSAMCSAVNGRSSRRIRTTTPMRSSSTMIGTAISDR